jgi:hypothetical protein
MCSAFVEGHMHRLLAAVLVVTTLIKASAAWACGAPFHPAPGVAGTALFEGPNQISIFNAKASGYTWERLAGPNWTRTHVLDITGTLDGNIETDARVDRAIAGQNGNVVEVSSSGVNPIGSSPEATTTIFGAALDPQQHWQVLTYVSTTKTLAVFSETEPGNFTEVSRISADCGQPEMLDVVVEPDGTFVGLCSGQPVLLVDNQIKVAHLPTLAIALGRSTQGDSVLYGYASNGTDLVRMSRSGSTWAIDSTIPMTETISWMIPVNESSVLINSTGDFIEYTLVDGTWQGSSYLGGLSVTSAFGSPAQILSGQYELTLTRQASGGWTTTDLGPMGIAPQLSIPNRSAGGIDVGCQSTSGEVLVPLFVFAFFFTRRLRLAWK